MFVCTCLTLNGESFVSTHNDDEWGLSMMMYVYVRDDDDYDENVYVTT